MEERLQKVLARAGYCSRRSCEDLIAKGHVTVYGCIARLGTKADPAKDKITIIDNAINASEKFITGHFLHEGD